MGFQDHVTYNGTRYDFRDTGAREQIGEVKSAFEQLVSGVETLSYEQILNKGFNKNTGAFPDENNWDITSFIPVVGGQPIWIDNPDLLTGYNGWYRADQSYIGWFSVPKGTNIKFMPPEDAAFVVLSHNHSYFKFVVRSMVETLTTREYVDKESSKLKVLVDGVMTGKYLFNWTLGNIALSTGLEEDSTFCIRTLFTKFLQPVVIHPYIATGYSNYICKYDTSYHFVSYEFFDADYPITDTNALYRLKLLKTDLSDIDISLSNNIYYEASATTKLNGKTIVCFGDSITGNFRPPQNYETELSILSGATVIDAGFGGCCMSDNNGARYQFSMCNLADSIVSGNWSLQENSGVTIDYARVNSAGTAYEATGIDYVASKLTLLKSLDWSKVDYIVIFFGTNDWAYDYLLDNANDAYDKTKYLGAFRYAVETILTAYPNIRIIPVTPCWRWWDTNTGAGAYGDTDTTANRVSHLKLSEFADGLIDVAKKKYHLPVFDLYYNSGFNKINRHEYFFTNDGTHPKPYGLSVIGEKLAEVIEAN